MLINVEADILAAAKRGDEKGFEGLVTAFEKPIYHYLCRVVGERETAEDLTQETFLRVYQHRQALDPAGNVKAWIFQIATNIARDWYQSQGRKEALSIPIDEEDERLETLSEEPTYKYIESQFARAELDAALQQLKPVYRAVLVMHYYDEQPYEDIAAALSVPVNTIKTHVRRAKKALQEVMKQTLISQQYESNK